MYYKHIWSYIVYVYVYMGKSVQTHRHTHTLDKNWIIIVIRQELESCNVQTSLDH